MAENTRLPGHTLIPAAELDRLRLGVALRCDLLVDIGDALEAAYGPGAAHAVRAAERSLRRLAEGTNPVAVLLVAADEIENGDDHA